jgi:hypothetical protein
MSITIFAIPVILKDLYESYLSALFHVTSNKVTKTTPFPMIQLQYIRVTLTQEDMYNRFANLECAILHPAAEDIIQRICVAVVQGNKPYAAALYNAHKLELFNFKVLRNPEILPYISQGHILTVPRLDPSVL